MPTPAEMVATLETALAQGPGVDTVTIDGVTVRMNRAQALAELKYWKREAARAAGTRPVVATIRLGNQ